MKTVFLATVEGGRLSLGSEHNKARFNDYLRGNEGKKLRITEEEKPKRSLSQNRYYWLYLELVEKETGNGANELHEYFRRTLLPPKFLTVLGKEIKVPKSTTELTKHEFGEYLDKISSMTEVPLPDPTLLGYQTTWKSITRPTNYPENNLGEPML